MYKNNKITKSNSFIEARYKLSLAEQRLVLSVISQIEPDDEDFNTYSINVSDFVELAGVRNKNAYSQMKKITDSLQTKLIIINKGDSELRATWFSTAEYFKGKGYVEVEISPKLKPYLLKLKERFTTYKLRTVMQLKSIYSIRIYELLKQYEKIGKRVFVVEELKEKLGVEKKYSLYGDFKKKILQVAEKELAEKTDIYFTFKEVKEGRKVTFIDFTILPTKLGESVSEGKISEMDSEVVLDLISFGMNKEISLEILHKKWTFLQNRSVKDSYNSELQFADYIRAQISYVNEKMKKGTAKDPVPYLLKAIKEGYANVDEFLKTKRERELKRLNFEIEKLKEELINFKNRLTLEIELAIEEMVTENPELVDEAVIHLRKIDNSSVKLRYNNSFSALENYKKKTPIRLAVNEFLENRFPESFHKPVEKYEKNVRKVNRHILEFEERMNYLKDKLGKRQTKLF
ncbi:MAG: replication initiation protein [Calditrichaeota bacterium]|nr:MAG: replication initiation protein [Calditrichota bacterium]